MDTQKYMRITSAFFILPLIYFFSTTRKVSFEWVLASLLVVVTATSQLFWNNPVKYTQFHILDTVVAKTTIILFILYTIYCKLSSVSHMISYAVVITCVTLSFLLSSHYSSKTWLCEKHILSHGSLHISCIIAAFYAFL
jgi:hypothetical protein